MKRNECKKIISFLILGWFIIISTVYFLQRCSSFLQRSHELEDYVCGLFVCNCYQLTLALKRLRLYSCRKYLVGSRFHRAVVWGKMLFKWNSSHLRKTEGMLLVCYYVSGMSSSCCEGLPRRDQGMSSVRVPSVEVAIEKQEACHIRPVGERLKGRK